MKPSIDKHNAMQATPTTDSNKFILSADSKIEDLQGVSRNMHVYLHNASPEIVAAIPKCMAVVINEFSTIAAVAALSNIKMQGVLLANAKPDVVAVIPANVNVIIYKESTVVAVEALSSSRIERAFLSDAEEDVAAVIPDYMGINFASGITDAAMAGLNAKRKGIIYIENYFNASEKKYLLLGNATENAIANIPDDVDVIIYRNSTIAAIQALCAKREKSGVNRYLYFSDVQDNVIAAIPDNVHIRFDEYRQGFNINALYCSRKCPVLLCLPDSYQDIPKDFSANVIIDKNSVSSTVAKLCEEIRKSGVKSYLYLGDAEPEVIAAISDDMKVMIYKESTIAAVNALCAKREKIGVKKYLYLGDAKKAVVAAIPDYMHVIIGEFTTVATVAGLSPNREGRVFIGDAKETVVAAIPDTVDVIINENSKNTAVKKLCANRTGFVYLSNANASAVRAIPSGVTVVLNSDSTEDVPKNLPKGVTSVALGNVTKMLVNNLPSHLKIIMINRLIKFEAIQALQKNVRPIIVLNNALAETVEALPTHITTVEINSLTSLQAIKQIQTNIKVIIISENFPKLKKSLLADIQAALSWVRIILPIKFHHDVLSWAKDTSIKADQIEFSMVGTNDSDDDNDKINLNDKQKVSITDESTKVDLKNIPKNIHTVRVYSGININGLPRHVKTIIAQNVVPTQIPSTVQTVCLVGKATNMLSNIPTSVLKVELIVDDAMTKDDIVAIQEAVNTNPAIPTINSARLCCGASNEALALLPNSITELVLDGLLTDHKKAQLPTLTNLPNLQLVDLVNTDVSIASTITQKYPNIPTIKIHTNTKDTTVACFKDVTKVIIDGNVEENVLKAVLALPKVTQIVVLEKSLHQTVQALWTAKKSQQAKVKSVTPTIGNDSVSREIEIYHVDNKQHKELPIQKNSSARNSIAENSNFNTPIIFSNKSAPKHITQDRKQKADLVFMKCCEVLDACIEDCQNIFALEFGRKIEKAMFERKIIKHNETDSGLIMSGMLFYVENVIGDATEKLNKEDEDVIQHVCGSDVIEMNSYEKLPARQTTSKTNSFNKHQINSIRLLREYTLQHKEESMQQQGRSPQAQNLHTLICGCCKEFNETAFHKLKNSIDKNSYKALLEYSTNGFTCLHDIFHLSYALHETLNINNQSEDKKAGKEISAIALNLFGIITQAIENGLEKKQIDKELVCKWIIKKATAEPEFTILNHLFIYSDEKTCNTVVDWLAKMVSQGVLSEINYRQLVWDTKLAFNRSKIDSTGLQELLRLTVKEEIQPAKKIEL